MHKDTLKQTDRQIHPGQSLDSAPWRFYLPRQFVDYSPTSQQDTDTAVAHFGDAPFNQALQNLYVLDLATHDCRNLFIRYKQSIKRSPANCKAFSKNENVFIKSISHLPEKTLIFSMDKCL